GGDIGAGGCPRGRDELNVEARVVAERPPDELDGREALGEIAADGVLHLARRMTEERRGIRPNAISMTPAQNETERLAERLAYDVEAGVDHAGHHLDGDAVL